MATIKLTLEKSDVIPSPPSTITFPAWQSPYPNGPQEVIEVMRRLGSNEVIRQSLGMESQVQTARVIANYDTYSDYESEINKLTKACDKTTFYTFEDVDNEHVVEHFCLLSFRHRARKAKGGLNDDDVSVYVQYDLTYLVDGENE